ncbi:MAG: dicarboxylate/amino acid:cation symporter [Alphaproteobacteria bacterium]|nr:dicarboxylate/amino acid:cation symporter [Alphaproteobacteria bacterium]
MQKNLTRSIFLAFFFGILTGILTGYVSNFSNDVSKYIVGIYRFGGDVFLKILKMLVVPIVFFSLVSGVSNLNNITSLGRIGIKTISLYIITTLFAISISLTIGTFLDPGNSVSVISDKNAINLNSPPSIGSVFLNIIPENPFKSLVEGNMLQVIFFAILFGACLSSLKQNTVLIGIVFKLNDLILKMLEVLMKIAPLGIFCLIAKTFSSQGIESILELLKYFLGVVMVLFIHLFLVYLPLVKLIAKVNISSFFAGLKEALLFAFSTSSSSATIPITLNNLDKSFKVKKKISSFTVPLGATINMDGTAIMQGMATIFIANFYGVELILTDFLTIIVTATLASIGTAGVPGVGMIMLGMVLNQVGLPLEGIAIVMGVDRLLDMLRTSLNVAGDATVTLIINKVEK